MSHNATDDETDQTDVADPVDRRVRICADRCATCIFRPGNLMHLDPGRVRGMVRAAVANSGHVTCHKTLNGNPQGLPGAVCYGWARHRQASGSLALVALRMFKRVGLVDTETGVITHHDHYTLEGAMGTWGTGPLDTDTALDFLRSLAMQPAPADREAAIAAQLELLAGYDPSHAVSRADDEELSASTLETGLAACALIAQKLAGEYLYGYRPEPQDAEGDPEFELGMLPDVTPQQLDRANRAMAVAGGLFGHPDLPQWTTDQGAIEHLAMLEELTARLRDAAPTTPQ